MEEWDLEFLASSEKSLGFEVREIAGARDGWRSLEALSCFNMFHVFHYYYHPLIHSKQHQE